MFNYIFAICLNASHYGEHYIDDIVGGFKLAQFNV